ncbi:hypothetical protein BC833DRAFT_613510, partial [Globomyces pollinis-pini]
IGKYCIDIETLFFYTLISTYFLLIAPYYPIIQHYVGIASYFMHPILHLQVEYLLYTSPFCTHHSVVVFDRMVRNYERFQWIVVRKNIDNIQKVYHEIQICNRNRQTLHISPFLLLLR